MNSCGKSPEMSGSGQSGRTELTPIKTLELLPGGPGTRDDIACLDLRYPKCAISMSTLAAVPHEAARTQRIVRGIDGLDQLREIVCGSDLQLEQLRRGELKAKFVRVNLGPLTFDSAKYSLPVRAVGRGNSQTVSFVLVRSAVVFNGERLQRGDIVLYPMGAEFEGFAKSSFSDYVFTVRPEDLARFADATGSEVDVGQFKAFTTLPRSLTATTRLTRLAACLDRGTSLVTRRSSLLASRITACLCDVLAAKSNRGRRPSSLGRQIHLIRSAEPFLIRYREEPLALASISGELGVSPRTLQMAFAAVTGVGPNEYGRILRLHAVRRELRRLKTGVTVTDVALRHSFSHLGRFSAYYREFFGETPSETLRRVTVGVRDS